MIAIILVSEQTLPNVLFLKQFEPFENYIFLTTQKMENEGRSDWIIKAARIHPDQVKRIEIDPENSNLSIEKLEKHFWPTNRKYLINLTGGTKMMALATFTFFSEKSNCRILYLPINTKSFLSIHPNGDEIPFSTTISIEEYLNAYGTVIQSYEANWMPYSEQSQKIMKIILKKDRNKKDLEILDLLDPSGRNELNAQERKFYSGQWFEIWLAWAIHNYLEIPEEDIRVGVKLNRIGISPHSTFEYDVIFIQDNRLYAAECKYFSRNKFQIGKINKELFKFASMNSQLGLYARPFFAIGNKIQIPNQVQVLKDQCEILNLKYPADIDVLSDPNKFITFMNNI